MAANLGQLFERLARLDGRASLDFLMAELEGLTLDRAEIGPHVRFNPAAYARNLLHAGPWHHALILCWRNGQRSPIHDHQGSSCAVRVIEGVLTETLFAFAPTGQIKAVGSRDLGPGDITVSADLDLHQVSNLQPGNADLITLHIYSPPLLVMGTYSLTDRRRGEEPMFVDFTDSAGI